ncbi:hypothetical protein [Streptomyces sp. XY431]|uniref:hypothetical protein n=1 Tax=Streptomyces sp. XY431 TaxID=1415562 RepID=UPI0006AFA0B1|nr:hypothetical protein [Streptomyces sp. XY431]
MVVVVGESVNDREVLIELTRARLGTATAGDYTFVQDKSVHALRDASGAGLDFRVGKIVSLAKAHAARQRGTLAGLLVHFDLDQQIGPQYDQIRSRVATAFRSGTAARVALALAAVETESWLLLYPDAFTAVHAGWKVPQQQRGKNTALSPDDPKRMLQRELGKPVYRESDSPAVIRKAMALDLQPLGSNRSHHDFLTDLTDW